MPPPVNEVPEKTYTVEQIFKNKGLTLWWNQPVGQRYGQGGEAGTDFDMPSNTKVGAISGGIVTYVGLGGYPVGSSTGYLIEIHSPDGMYLYLHNSKALVSVGNAVQPGDIIALSGGCPTAINCRGGGACGCQAGCDCHSTGYHIEVRWTGSYKATSNPWQGGGSGIQGWSDPLSHFHQVAATPAGSLSSESVGVGTRNFLDALSSSFGGVNLPNPWRLDEGVSEAFYNFDNILTLYAPINCPDNCLTLGLINLPLPDPIYFLTTVWRDVDALIFRFGMIGLGLYMIFKIINQSIDITGKIGSAIQVGTTAASLVA